MGYMRVDKSNIYKKNKENMNKLEEKEWTGVLYIRGLK